MTSEELKIRTKEFALQVLRLINDLQLNRANHIILNQLGRSATGMAANYRAACKSRSTKEFIAKLGVVVEEADESWFWLDLLNELNDTRQKLQTLKMEAYELTAIFTQSLKTARKNQTTQ